MKDGRSSGWVVTGRKSGEICYDDSVDKLRTIGNSIRDRLLADFEIRDIWDLVSALADEDLKGDLCDTFTDEKVELWHDQIEEEVTRESPDPINYRDQGNPDSNPYELRYSAGWMEVIKRVSALSPFICVKEYVEHIVNEVCCYCCCCCCCHNPAH